MMVIRGQTARFVVWYDTTLVNGTALADAVLGGCENDLDRMSNLFGGLLPNPASLPFTVNLQAGAGSASHSTCLDTTIYYPAANGSPGGVLTTIDAEVAEVMMATQNLGFNCGYSNGEALSRVLATVLYPERSVFFSVANEWLNSATRTDYVSANDPTDQNFVSIGCGTLFLNYLAHQLNFTWQQILAAAGPTLAQTAANLGVANAFADFSALLQAHFPAGTTTNLPDDNPFPLLTQSDLYIRHNLADDGTSHTGPLSKSPDIIVKNNVMASVLFTTPLSVNSDDESDPYVLDGQENFLYVRMWNRGPDTTNVEAAVYWSPPATLVDPSMWNHISTGVVPDVPGPGMLMQVTAPLGWDQSSIPAPGHYCFIATVGNAEHPAPAPTAFATFDDFVAYIAAHNNIAWRNFNVVAALPFKQGRFKGFIALPFLITGAWDKARAFTLETIAGLPKGSRLALQVARDIGRELAPTKAKIEHLEDRKTDRHQPRRLRIFVASGRPHRLRRVKLPASSRAPSHLLVQIPDDHRDRIHEVAVRQMYAGREVGRITWRISPHVKPLARM
jgi:hypothetical protein